MDFYLFYRISNFLIQQYNNEQKIELTQACWKVDLAFTKKKDEFKAKDFSTKDTTSISLLRLDTEVIEQEFLVMIVSVKNNAEMILKKLKYASAT